jgi:hypothetical protein
VASRRRWSDVNDSFLPPVAASLPRSISPRIRGRITAMTFRIGRVLDNLPERYRTVLVVVGPIVDFPIPSQ